MSNKRVKKPEDIEGIRESCKRLAVILRRVGEAVRPGITTGELDALAVEGKLRDDRKQLLTNQVRLALGAAEVGRLPDGSGWSAKLVARKGYTVEPSSSRQLRRLKA